MKANEFVDQAIRRFDELIEAVTKDAQTCDKDAISDAVLTCLFGCREQLAETKAIADMS